MKSMKANVLDQSAYYFYTPSLQAVKTFFYPIVLGYSIFAKDYRLYRNSYDSFLIMQVTKGKCFVQLDSKTYTAKPNQIVIIDCYKPHSYYSYADWEAKWIHIDGPLAREFYQLIHASFGNIITLKDIYSFEHALQKIFSVFEENTPIKEVLLNKYITELLTQLLMSNDSDVILTSHMDMIEETSAYIGEHFREDLTLEFLAARASLSPFYFTRVFKKYTGLTPHDYLLTTRINFAKFLLKTTDTSIKDICYQTGFSSETNFCCTFKKREKMTPSTYREIDNG